MSSVLLDNYWEQDRICSPAASPSPTLPPFPHSISVCPSLSALPYPVPSCRVRQQRTSNSAGHVALPQKLKPMATCLVAAPEQTLRLPRLRMSILDPDGSTMNGARENWHVGEISSFSILAHLLELDARSDPSACRSSMCNPTYKSITPT